jgi:hypothetical protein
MQQIIVELDDETVRRLNKVAPPKERKRSEFIREAIRKALNERIELEMEAAYRRQPDDFEPPMLAETWEKVRPARRKKSRR